MRVSGLATGMDTESIIKDMMHAHRIPLDKITQKKQYLEWQLDDYRSINRNLTSMSSNVNNTILQESTFISKSMSISNEAAVDIRNLNSTSEFSGTLSIERLATNATLQSLKDGQIIDLTAKLDQLPGFGQGEQTITIEALNAKGVMEPTTVMIDTSQHTMKSALAKISKEANVSAFYDEFTGQIAFTAKNSGEGSIIVSGGFADSLKLNDQQAQDGLNAKFTFNGLETERASNTFEINGFEFNLKQVTTGDITFSSSPDTDKIMDSVVKFVDDYNKMLEELNDKIRESKYRDFQPLSSEQKKEMSDKEIELWEEKAMSGTLRNDPTIQSMLSELRNVLNSSVTGSDGEEIRLSDLGITTSSNYLDNGKLVVNEDKLRQAISDNPNKVYEAFAKTGDTAEEQGLAVRFHSVIVAGQKSISNRAGSAGAVNDTFTLGRTMKEMNNQITRFEDRMKMVESQLWKQFGAMEMAIQRLNAQSANLMSALGG